MSSPNDREEGLRGYMSSVGIPVEWIRRLLESDTRTDNLIITLAELTDATGTFHKPTITPVGGTNAPGQQPDISTIGTTLVAEFTPDTDKAYRIFKVPANFVSDAAFHVHWTKESGVGGNSDESGNTVQWRISYTVFPGSVADINVAPTGVLNISDTYTDAGTTTRIVHRSGDIPAPGFVANYYVGVCVEAIGAGTTLGAEAALISVDLTFTEFLNKDA